ncbi:TolC family protein, partial [Candidatus Poribacteria bacterium]|nr:TolC family protein [Candidatus Poribacteria bacterium]
MMKNILIISMAFVFMVLLTSGFSFAVSFDGLPDFLSGESEKALLEDLPEEEIDFSQPLTLEKCIDIALKRSVNIKTGKLDLILDNMNVNDARSNYLPRIDTSGSYQFSDRIDFGWEKENYDASVSARYTIWDNGQREASLTQAKLRRDGRNSSIYRTKQNLIYNIINSYYNILEAEKLILVDENALERSRQNVEKIKAFVEVGNAIESDIATAKVQQANDELTLINDKNNLELAKANMAALMGLDPDTQFDIVDDLDYDKLIQTGNLKDSQIEADRIRLTAISMDDAVARAMEKRPEVAELKTNKAVLETALNLAQLQRWPQISADCGYNIFLDDYLRERDALKNHKSWNVQARVSYTIFDSGRTRRNVEKADIALLKLNENANELERSITLEVYQAYLSLERARKSLEIAS